MCILYLTEFLIIRTCVKIVAENRFLCKRGLNGQSYPNSFLKSRFIYAGFLKLYCIELDSNVSEIARKEMQDAD